ncbi:unnamed protein product [Protopolystoma xenopodis]|uniref:Uncharacterized protein n=1 Tax=Protopolystoma xenopodis TaxID=117903 RepID=A0A448WYT2_9PLAT|nr:unnamed protein product [Protopolystoma xenopodis]
MGPEGLQPAFNYLHKSGVEPRQMNFRRRMSTFVLPPIASESSEGRWNEQSDQIRNSKQTRHSNNASGGSKKDSPLEDFGRQPSTFLPPNVGNESSKGKWDGQKDHKRGLQRPHYSSSSSERDKNDSPLKNFGRRLSTLLLPNAGNESPDGKWDRQRDNRRGSQRPRYSSSSSERNKNDSPLKNFGRRLSTLLLPNAGNESSDGKWDGQRDNRRGSQRPRYSSSSSERDKNNSPLKNFGRRLSTLLLPNAGNESSDGKWDGQRDNRRGSQRPRYSSSSSERDKNDSPLKNFGRRLSTLLLPNVGNDSSEGKRDGQRDHRRGSQRPRYSSSSSERSKIDSPLKNFGRRLSTLLLPSKPDEGSRDRRGSHYSSSPSKKSVEDSPLANFGRRLSTFLLPPMDSDRSDNFGYEKSKQRRASQWSSNKEARRKSSQGHRSSSSREDSKFSKSRRKSSIRSLMISPYVQSQIRYDPNSRSSFTDDKSNVAKRVGKFVKRIFVSKKDEHRYK